MAGSGRDTKAGGHDPAMKDFILVAGEETVFTDVRREQTRTYTRTHTYTFIQSIATIATKIPMMEFGPQSSAP